MEELKNIETYQEFKKALDAELHNQAEGFVRTGYLLKVARDTDILRESGYATVAEFAHAEYGLTKDVVSRYIAINDRYSEGGYSERLKEQYRGYGVAKLQDMLTLPDAIIEVMSPEMTRKDIQEIKREYKEEVGNPLASLMEDPKREQEEMTMLQKAMHQHMHDNNEDFTKGFDMAMRAETEKEEAINGILDALAPTGVGIKSVRIQGIGRVMISFRGKDTEIEILNARTQERQSYTWQGFIDELREVFVLKEGESGVEAWERIYGEEYQEKKQEVAPVQQQKEEKPAETLNKERVSDTKKREKTEEQKYDEKQRKIDKQTKERLEKIEDEKKMSVLPSERPKEVVVHQIRLAAMYYDDVAEKRMTFLLRKKDKDYKVGDMLEMMEFKEGKNTGRTLMAEVIYLLEDYTGLEEDYCIMGMKVTKERL